VLEEDDVVAEERLSLDLGLDAARGFAGGGQMRLL
jgi:hypothetical protein